MSITRSIKEETEADMWERVIAILDMIPKDISIFIVMGYVFDRVPCLLSTSPHPSQFFIKKGNYTFFSHHLSLLNELDLHSIWGRQSEVESILENNLDPSLLLTRVSGDDQRGPGHIIAGTILERVIYLGDVYITDEKNETMATMVMRYVRLRCGEEECKMQIRRAKHCIEMDKTKKLLMQKADSNALKNVWGILRLANENTLKQNTKLQEAMVAWNNQIKLPGNETIIEEATKFYFRSFDEFGGSNSPKNKFAADELVGFAQLMRLSICDLQICFAGVKRFSQADEHLIGRIDVRRELGMLNTEKNVLSLGFSCYLDTWEGGVQKAPKKSANFYNNHVSFLTLSILKTKELEKLYLWSLIKSRHTRNMLKIG